MFSKAALSLAALSAASCSARIVGIAAPNFVAQGTLVPITLLVEDFSQAITDVSVVFGLSSNTFDPASIGAYLNSSYLGPSQSNVLTNITEYVRIPASYPTGNITLTAAITSLIGAGADVSTTLFSLLTQVIPDHVPYYPTEVTGTNPINACATTAASSTTTSSAATTATSGFTTSTTTIVPKSTTSSSPGAGFGDIQPLITEAKAAINTVINDIAQQKTTAKQDFGVAVGLLGEVFQTVSSSGQCKAPTSYPPSTISANQAITLLQDMQQGLSYVAQDEINNNSTQAFADICAVLALVDGVNSFV